jgi:hypothetical protein
MQQRIIGEAAASTAASCPHLLATLRAQLTALTFGSPWLTAAEQIRANHHAHECEDAGRLGRWLVNTPAVLARRAVEYQRQQVQAGLTRLREDLAQPSSNCLTQAGSVGLPPQLQVLNPLDCLAGVADGLAVASFGMGEGLSYAELLHS